MDIQHATITSKNKWIKNLKTLNYKRILHLIVLIFTTYFSKAQLSIGGFSGFVMPIGNDAETVFVKKEIKESDYRTFSKGFFPLGITLKYQFTKKFICSASYQDAININESYFEKNNSSYKHTFTNNIRSFNLSGSLLFGHFLENKMQMLAGLNVGLYSTDLSKVYASNQVIEVETYNSKNRIGLGIQYGYRYLLSDKISWETTLNYHYIFTSELVKLNGNYGYYYKPFLSFNNSQLLGIETGLNFNF